MYEFISEQAEAARLFLTRAYHMIFTFRLSLSRGHAFELIISVKKRDRCGARTVTHLSRNRPASGIHDSPFSIIPKPTIASAHTAQIVA